ncbi:GNAT family N-acetyltransferase [Actinosynnema sp. NPDC004786]
MIHLRPLDDSGVERLLGLAVADTDPADVMPPGWTVDRPDEFRDFYRDLQPDAYEIVDGDRTVGMARLTAHGDIGMWLVRCARGRGTGPATLHRLKDEAARRGITTLVAHTTTDNHAALAALRKAGAALHTDGPRATARLTVEPARDPDDAVT